MKDRSLNIEHRAEALRDSAGAEAGGATEPSNIEHRRTAGSLALPAWDVALVVRLLPGSARVSRADAGVLACANFPRRALSEGEDQLESARQRKFVAPGRRDQHARRVRSPAGSLAAPAATLALLAALASGVIGSVVFAEEAKAARPAGDPEMVIVPYDSTKPVAAQKPDQFYLPYERFLELWQALKEKRTGKKAEPAPVRFALSAARYDGLVGEQAVAFYGKLEVTTFDAEWVKVPLPFAGVKIGTLTIDGVGAAYDGASLLVAKPGRHAVEVTFEIPLARGAKAFEWGIPRTGAAVVALTLRDLRSGATITPGSGVIERIEQGKKVVTAAVGTTDRVRVELQPQTEIARVAEPAVASVSAELTVRGGLEEAAAQFAFSFPGARQDRFTVFFEKGLTLAAIEAENMKSWKLAEAGGRQALEIELNESVTEAFAFLIRAERAIETRAGARGDARERVPPAIAAAAAERSAPVFSAAAKRVEQTAFALFAGAGIELTPLPAAGQRQVTWRGFAWWAPEKSRESARLFPDAEVHSEARLVAAFAGEGELRYRAMLAEPRREARVDYVYQVNRRKIELIASLQLFAKGDDLSAVTLSLPAEFEVQAVASERLQDWWREGDALHVRFKNTTPEMTPLVVYLVRQFAAAPTQLEVRPLTLAGFKNIAGEAVIAAHKGVDAAMKLSADGKEIAPEKAATDFQILPPLERKRGFTFSTQNFAAQVTLAALPAKSHALWVLHAQAHEGWIALSMHARLTMRQGSIDRTTFTLPAATPEARVSGGEVRETRSRIEGGRRVYEVQFQNDVYESVEFTADLELPNAGEAALPAIAFPEAALTSGFVLTDNASEYEMKLKTSGVDPAPVSEIPFLPALTKNAGVFRAQPNWAVTIALERLEKAASRAAFVAWAELTSGLRRDGTEWHRATYRLQNRSLQFLPVRLPAGAELMSARVAGQSVRADAGKVDGREAILVPLIKTRPGDLSYDVELVYRLQRPMLGWWTARELRDPELPGITIERTFWNVWLPEDRRLQSTSGNMDAVLADVNKTEKLEGALQELKSLAAVVGSSSASYATRENAKANWGLLKSQIESESGDDKFADTNSYLRRGGATPKPTPAEATVGKKGIAQQTEEVANKRRAINDELGRETRKLAELEKAVPPAPTFSMAARQPVVAGARGGAPAITNNAIDELLFKAQPGALQSPARDASAKQAGADQITMAGGTLTISGVDARAGAAGGEQWAKNNSYSSAQTSVAAPATATANAGNNLFLNDNLILQQRAAPAEKAASVSQKQEDRQPRSAHDLEVSASRKLERNESGRRFDERAKQMPETPQLQEAQVQAKEISEKRKAGAAEKSVSEPAESGKDTVLNTARGNNALVSAPRQQPQGGAQAQAEAPAQTRSPEKTREETAVVKPMNAAEQLRRSPAAPPAAAPLTSALSAATPAPAVPGLMPQTFSGVTTSEGRGALPLGSADAKNAAQAIAGARGAGGAAREESAFANAERSRTAGRISLAVDFPNEGQVFHFKKVKTNAQLKLTLLAPEAFERWGFAALALALAAALAGIERLRRRYFSSDCAMGIARRKV